MNKRSFLYGILLLVTTLVIVGTYRASAWTTVSVVDDPLVRMPGSQPAQNVSLESPNRCLNCHAGYNTAVEPGFNWQGSMMAHSARDFLWWAAMTVAGQDSVWAIGTPNAVDLCERCHFPGGWLGGRSDPPNASAMSGADYDGVQCDFCHLMVDMHFEKTYQGAGESADWLNYWDEQNNGATPSQAAANATRQEDVTLAQSLTFFNGTPFYADNYPVSTAYSESTSGQYFVSPNGAKRASFADAAARHQMFYSRFHKSRTFCATYHDVSNPVLANLGADPSLPLPSEEQAAFAYNHAERTYSEFVLSAYGQSGGAAGIGPFAPGVYETSLANDYIARCQDCHMRDVVGRGANKNGVPIRPDESTEHPLSGQPLHDLTGGNIWVSAVLASTVTGSPNYDATNAALLRQGSAVLTLDLNQGLGIDPVALLAGRDRAEQQLQLAATIENVDYDGTTGTLAFRVQNQSGHKLISGFPEGRRMFVNIRAFADGNLIYEVNPYDADGRTLKGLVYNYQAGFGLPLPVGLNPATELYVDELIYEMVPMSSLTGEEHTFHFALADDRYKDNRIPPQGFRIEEATARLSQPRWHGEDALDYFSAAEYAGGYDDVTLALPPGADAVEVNLYYQTTSREYIEFLRDEINGNSANITLPPAPWVSGDPDPGNYIVQSDPFFAKLKAWGNTIWDVWLHTSDWPGAAPYLMTQAVVGDVGGCVLPTPTLLTATAGHSEVTLAWSDVHSAEPQIVGYRLYYDQSDKFQLVADPGLVLQHTDTGLTNGEQYCYAVTAYAADGCESAESNILCATPDNQAQGTVTITTLQTGYYQGNGGNKQFVPATTFVAGSKVVIRATAVNAVTGVPVAGAVVNLAVNDPFGSTVTTIGSDTNGIAEGTWQTRKRGLPPGPYTLTVTQVTLDGFVWDNLAPTAQVTIQ